MSYLISGLRIGLASPTVTYSPTWRFLNKCRSVRKLSKFNTIYGVKSRTFRSAKIAQSFFQSAAYHSTNDEDVEDLQGRLSHKYVLSDDPIHRSHSAAHLESSDDPLIRRLNECESIQSVLECVKASHDQMGPEHTAQAISVLWDIRQAILYSFRISVESSKTPGRQSVTSNRSYMAQVVGHPDFGHLLDLVAQHVNAFDVDSLSCILIYLTRFGVDTGQEALRAITSRMNYLVSTDRVTLTSLSRFVVAVIQDNNIGSFLLVRNVIPVVSERLEQCEDPEDFRLVTICLTNLHKMLSRNILEKYRTKVGLFLDTGKLNFSSYKCILKVVNFLSNPSWIEENVESICRLIGLLENNLHRLDVHELYDLLEVMYKIQEPGFILAELQDCASKLLDYFNDGPEDVPAEIRLKLLSIAMCFTSPSHRLDYEKAVRVHLEEPVSKVALLELCRISMFLKSSDDKFNDKLWTRVLDYLSSEEPGPDETSLLQFGHKYMNYTGDTGYRNNKFEKHMLVWLVEKLDSGLLGTFPSRFSLASSFILSYSKCDKDMTRVLNKILEDAEQFSSIDCVYLSKGLQNYEGSEDVLVTRLNKFLDDRALWTTLNDRDSMKLNYLLKGCMYRRKYAKGKLDLLDTLQKSVVDVPLLSSNKLRNFVWSVRCTSVLSPDIVNAMCRYITQNGRNLLGFNVQKVLTLFYDLGFWPGENFSNVFFKVCTDVLTRDWERLSGLSQIRAALALCYYRCVSTSLLGRIFNVDFLERLDVELANCYSRDVYPQRVRSSLMQLNRAVCIDYPDAGIPWFHQKYVDQLRRRRNVLERDVVPYLTQLVGEDVLETNVPIKYGYTVDFVVKGDKRIAFLVADRSAYTRINVHLKGRYQLMERHLNLLGWQLFFLDSAVWNSLVYGEEKLNYLKNLLRSNKSNSISIKNC